MSGRTGGGAAPIYLESLDAASRGPARRGQELLSRGGTEAAASGTGSGPNGARHFKKSRGLLCQGVGMRYRFIQAEKAVYPVEVLCRVLEVARSGFYAWGRRPLGIRAQQNDGLVTQIRTCYHAARGRYGSPRIHQDLRAQGVRVGRHRVARLMRLQGLRSIRRRRAWRSPGLPAPGVVATNILRGEFAATQLNAKWAGDITYVPTREGWLYLAVLMDLYSRRIVG